MSEERSNEDPMVKRRRFVQAASGALAASLVPSLAEAAESAVTKKIVAQVRKQLGAKTRMNNAQISAVVSRVRAVLPNLGEVAYGHVVFGVRIDEDGNPTGLSGCEDGHSCAGRFDEAPPDPTCEGQGTVCQAEACNDQSCDDHWCVENACDAEACDNNLCEEQACDTEACSDQDCTVNTDTNVIVQMSQSKGWKKIQANIAELKKAQKLEVTVVVQGPSGGP
jgi:hypothetical protein